MLQQYRHKADHTQASLAKELGVDTQFVSNMERGIAPIPPKHFKALHKIIGVPIPKLMKYNLSRYLERMKREMKK